MKKRTFIFALVIAFGVMIGLFIQYSFDHYKLDEKFTPIPLSFDPYNSSSSYNWNGAAVTVKGGFVKGKVKEDKGESLLVRALSPSPEITIRGNYLESSYLIRLENINPAKIQTQDLTQAFQVIDTSTILMALSVKADEEKVVAFQPKVVGTSEFVILGDNRNGYKTFANIINQINSIDPAFTIDNGDLVYGGEPNRYRLFYETVSKLKVPLFTALGNHDIRKNGRVIYTELFGPPYYSFDYQNTHFVFLDSSRGWSEKRSIPEEQYQWLEKDLQKAQGKRIFVISHIPSTDPRTNIEPNPFPDKTLVEKGLLENEMSKLSGTSILDHAFQDKEEAKRFESIMVKYKVDTVFLSHIHSYFSFIKDNVRYIITGGAGAELLTKGSYYHYIRVQVTNKENYLEVVELPSPPNKLVDRYLAAGQLFSSSIYKEYTSVVLMVGSALALLLAIVIWIFRKGCWLFLKHVATWLFEVLKFAVKKYKEIFKSVPKV